MNNSYFFELNFINNSLKCYFFSPILKKQFSLKNKHICYSNVSKIFYFSSVKHPNEVGV